MTYKQIEGARELRLWIGQVVVPTVMVGMALSSNPNVRKFIGSKYNELKSKVTRKRKLKIIDTRKGP